MRRGVGQFLVLAAVAVVVMGCPSAVPVQPTRSGQPTAQGTPPAGADLYGSVRYEDQSSFTNPPEDENGNGDDSYLATIDVALARGSDGEYVDAGSTYTVHVESHRDKSIGIAPNVCRGHSSTLADVSDKKFSDPPSSPDDPGSTIGAIYDPDLRFFSLNVDISYELTEQLDACMGGQAVTTTFWTGGVLLCGLGLEGAYVDVAGGPDEFDMACSIATDNGALTVSGTITIRE